MQPWKISPWSFTPALLWDGVPTVNDTIGVVAGRAVVVAENVPWTVAPLRPWQ
jgi:hypothetical protein